MNYQPDHPQWKAFVARLREAEPSDLTGRLVFADWLDEEYGGGNRLAALIRAMCNVQLGTANRLTPRGWFRDVPPGRDKDWVKYLRARQLLADTWRWWPPLGELVKDAPHLAAQWVFHAGFPEVVVIPFHSWLAHGDLLTALGPVGTVRVVRRPGCVIETGRSVVRFTVMDNALFLRLPPDRRTWVIHRRDWDAHDMPLLAQEEFYSDRIVENCLREIWPPPVVRGFEVNAQYDDLLPEVTSL